jgi:uncharacterized membrane protein
MADPTFQQLTEQVQRLTQRVALLEDELGLRRAVPNEPAPAPEAIVAAVAVPVLPRDLESSLGLRWINRVGAVTLILGIAFFFRYAAENNWIGEEARVLIGAAAGLLLLAGGEWAFRKDQRVFAQGITGAGAATLYLSCFTAFGAYHLLPVLVAFLLMAASTALAAYLALRYNAQAIAVLAIFGGFLVPLLAGDASRSVWSIPLYIVLLDAAFLGLATRRNWRLTQAFALLGTVLFTFAFEEKPLLVVLPLFYLLFALLPDWRLFAAAHILLLGRATALPIKTFAYPFELVLLSFGGLAVLWWRKWFRLTALLVTAAAASWFLASLWNPGPLPVTFVTLATLFLLFFVFSGWRAVVAPNLLSFGEVAAIPLAAVFFRPYYEALAGWGDSWAALLALVLAGLYLALAARLWGSPRHAPAPNPAAAASAGVGVAFLTLAIPLEFHNFTVTMVWAVEGAALVWIASQRRIFLAQVFGVAVLACAAARYAFLDATLRTSIPLWNARFASATVLAIALFLAAIWSRGTRLPTGVPGVAGHLVLLSGLSLEVAGWAQRAFGDRSSGPESAALSILFAFYAVILVALGTRERSAGSRYLGLGLIALVMVKLYLYDIWQLDLVYRFIAFAALGALLLAISFLYSRYRERLSSWLVPTPPAASEAHPRPLPE